MFDETQKFIVLLDLEETLIKSWNEPEWVGAGNNVMKFLHGEWLPHPIPMNCQLGLMSWAVWDEVDKKTFNEDLRPWLEDRLRFKFDDNLIFSMDDWSRLVFEATKCKVTRQDLFDICKKEDVLFKMRKHPMFHHATTWLIDDVVSKMELIECFDNQSKFIIRNVNHMFDEE